MFRTISGLWKCFSHLHSYALNSHVVILPLHAYYETQRRLDEAADVDKKCDTLQLLQRPKDTELIDTYIQ